MTVTLGLSLPTQATRDCSGRAGGLLGSHGSPRGTARIHSVNLGQITLFLCVSVSIPIK